jgi:hypothetical protein
MANCQDLSTPLLWSLATDNWLLKASSFETPE